MGEGKRRAAAGWAAAAAVAVLATAGAAMASSGPAASAPATGTAGAAPAAVPVLGTLTIGKFPATYDGGQALLLCQGWAGLRARYVASVRTQSPFQLEQWFSSPDWRPAFNANRPLLTDPAYTAISTAFGVASTGAAASIGNARLLDQACAAR